MMLGSHATLSIFSLSEQVILGHCIESSEVQLWANITICEIQFDQCIVWLHSAFYIPFICIKCRMFTHSP